MTITKDMLDSIQAEFGQVENLLAALDVMADAVNESCTGQKRQNLDGLIGVTDALSRQMAEAQKAFEVLFDALRNAEA